MSLLYRAIWQDDRDDLNDAGWEAFAHWIASKTDGLEVPIEGQAALGQDDVVVVRAADEQLRVMRAVLHEERQVTRWTTTFTILDGGPSDRWAWIDLEFVATNSFKRPDVIAPGLTALMLADGGAYRGPVRLTTKPRALRPEDVKGFVELLTDPTRDVPLAVFSADPYVAEAADWVARARHAAAILAGVAQVIMLPPDAINPFIDAVGRDMAVWGGAVRVYLPGIDIETPQQWRHRYLAPHQFSRGPRQAGLIVSRMLSSSLAARRGPGLYTHARRLLDEASGASTDVLEAQISDREMEIQRLREEIDELEGRYLDTLADYDEAQELVARHVRTISHMARPAEADEAVTDGLPETVATSAEAADLCRAHLQHVRLPQAACQDLDDLDNSNECRPWANGAWQALQALNAYAEQAAHWNGFWNFCEMSGDPRAWKATPKKLAMVESDTVRNDPRLRAHRILPIDPVVEMSGELFMEAHIKVATGGGDLAPRIYFFDDTKGETACIHVGFFGPHRHMPNTRT